MFDLIDECGKDLAMCGYETVELSRYNVTSSKLFVESKKQAKSLGFDMGHYFIINAPRLDLLMWEHKSLLEDEILKRLSFLFEKNKISRKSKVLVVGIGNPKIVADSFGVKSVEKIPIMPYSKRNRIFKIMPNTFSNTGLNAYDMIRLIVEWFGVDWVLIFDSLATTNIERLGCSVQFNDAGLTPGSAMNNFGLPINRSTLNVPCISIGVPMMISSRVFGEKREVIFTEKDAEEKIDFLSTLVAEVVEKLL